MILDRREFLFLGTAATAVKVMGGEPSTDAESALKLTRYEIDSAPDRPFSVLHVADANWGHAREYARERALPLLNSEEHPSFSVCVRDGIRFVTFDNSEINVSEETVRLVEAEFAKAGPIVLVCHYPPFYTAKFLDETQRVTGAKKRPANIWDSYDWRTRAFYAGVEADPRLKAVLCAHLPIAMSDGFSETSCMYVAGPSRAGCITELSFK